MRRKRMPQERRENLPVRPIRIAWSSLGMVARAKLPSATPCWERVFGERKDYTACDDGDLCTVGEVCLAGECSAELATSLDCDDGNPCTTESCDAEAGCTSLPTESCDDGNPCTAEDQCAGDCAGTGTTAPASRMKTA